MARCRIAFSANRSHQTPGKDARDLVESLFRCHGVRVPLTVVACLGHQSLRPGATQCAPPRVTYDVRMQGARICLPKAHIFDDHRDPLPVRISPVQCARSDEQSLYRGGCLGPRRRDFGSIRVGFSGRMARAGYLSVQSRDLFPVATNGRTPPPLRERGQSTGLIPWVSVRPAPKTTKPAACATGFGIAGAGFEPTTFGL